jgi:hypothetical protein
MSKQTTPLCSVAVVAIAALFSLPMPSVAQAQQGTAAPMHPKKHVVRILHPKWRESEISQRIYDVVPDQPHCTWQYTRMSPPCMSTWPEGSPNYHGTFRGNQWE